MRESHVERAVWKQKAGTEDEQLLSVMLQENEMTGKRRILIVGAGEVGHLLARSLQEA